MAALTEFDLDIGGRRLRVVASGQGAPSVILEAGSGCSSQTWRAVQEQAGEFTSTYSYDRAGHGASDPAGPWTLDGWVADLEGWLRAGPVPPPYVLVGHSLGGHVVRTFAARHPAEVSGLVLVDVRHEDLYPRLPRVRNSLVRIVQPRRRREGCLVDSAGFAQHAGRRSGHGQVHVHDRNLPRRKGRTRAPVTGQDLLSGDGHGRFVINKLLFMTEVIVDDFGRPAPPLEGAEVATLLGFLDYQRATLEWKCRGLTDDQLRVTLPPSSMTLGGLLKHLACVEDSWFTEVVAGGPAIEPWASVDLQADPEWNWRSAALDSGDYLRALWTEGVSRSRAVVQDQLLRGEQVALRETHADRQLPHPVSLRWVLVHLIEEYARHNGHADLIRESIDGLTGD